MIAPIDFGRLQLALTSTRGWLELLVAVLCIALAWAVDRRLEVRRKRLGNHLRVPGSVVRLAFPLLALALTYVASFAWGRYVGPPLLLAIATPILVALAIIRVIAYGLRRLFPAQAWLPAWEAGVSYVVWGFAILYFLGVLPEIAAALDDFNVPIGKSELSLLTMLQGVGVVILTLVVTLWISGFIEQRLTRATQLDANLRAVLAKSIKAVLIIIGVLIALQEIGFDLTLLTVFGGALGVGIGLGLQKLASNYIAGFTILLDRSIRIGDVVTVDNRYGTIARVTARYVVVRSLDGVESILPNETLVTTTVLNHTYTTKEVRVAVGARVTYDSDVEKALAMMEEVASTEPRVLRTPPPRAFVVRIAETGVDLELGVWINDPEAGNLDLRSALNRKMLAVFRAQSVVLASADPRLASTQAAAAGSGASAQTM